MIKYVDFIIRPTGLHNTTIFIQYEPTRKHTKD